MKELLLQYARYNVWANKRVIDVMLQLNTADLDREIVSSFSSLKKTTIHIMGAESIWLQRLQLAAHPIWLPESFKDIFSKACILWQQASLDLEGFISSEKDDAALVQVCSFNDRKGTPLEHEVSHILLHVFNHSTYHRGQLITMLRQIGMTEIPATDFIAFVRNITTTD